MKNTYLSIFLKFLRFGLLAWGGPVAQINMIREELVEREGWISPEKFKRVLAVYQALPGPEAHELCVYFGMIRKGRWGGFLAGLGFMLPGFILILLLSWAYTLLGSGVLLPLFVGVAPAVTALIVCALQRIGQHTLTSISLWSAAIVSIVLTALGVHFLLVFVVCASLQALWAVGSKRMAIVTLFLLSTAAMGITFVWSGADGLSVASSGGLFAEGLKAGLLSFGGAYTALPFLKESMVGVYPGVTPQAFVDGIALSSVIPAPLVIFGTYLGFLADGFTGALLVTLGIFIPAFSFTLVGHRWLEKMIENPALHGVLDGVAAGVVGILAITTVEIALQTLTGLWPVLIFSFALAGLYFLRGRWSVPVIILVCGLLGLILQEMV
ncbi:MAG: chromate efflux transporter [Alphaproteobacteria bacterium]